MQFSYYLHGTPYGFKYVGNPDEETQFFKRYYNGKRDIDEFRIETRQVNGMFTILIFLEPMYTMDRTCVQELIWV